MAKSHLKLLLFAILSLPVFTVVAEIGDARTALDQGRLDDAETKLLAHLKASPHDTVANQLLCRAFYAEELADNAIFACEVAVADSHSDNALASQNEMWLGRAYGLKASNTNPIQAFRLARRVVAAFEQAVELDPNNFAALSDLGEYYVDAPSIVGGGLDKADRLAARLMPVSVTKAHRLLAMIAEKRSNNSIAEAEFKRAFETQRTPQTLVDLAAFYQRQQQCDQAVTAVRALARMDQTRDAAIVDAASVLKACNREPKLAQELMANYLLSPAKSDSAPAPRVHVQLGDSLAKTGDSTGAQREYRAALALAAEYEPARKAMQGR